MSLRRSRHLSNTRNRGIKSKFFNTVKHKFKLMRGDDNYPSFAEMTYTERTKKNRIYEESFLKRIESEIEGGVKAKLWHWELCDPDKFKVDLSEYIKARS